MQIQHRNDHMAERLRRRASLCYRGHVENDVVVVAGLALEEPRLNQK